VAGEGSSAGDGGGVGGGRQSVAIDSLQGAVVINVPSVRRGDRMRVRLGVAGGEGGERHHTGSAQSAKRRAGGVDSSSSIDSSRDSSSNDNSSSMHVTPPCMYAPLVQQKVSNHNGTHCVSGVVAAELRRARRYTPVSRG
jgi:hypothetical protein